MIKIIYNILYHYCPIYNDNLPVTGGNLSIFFTYRQVIVVCEYEKSQPVAWQGSNHFKTLSGYVGLNALCMAIVPNILILKETSLNPASCMAAASSSALRKLFVDSGR